MVWLKHWRLELLFYFGGLAGGCVLSKFIHMMLLQIAIHFKLPIKAAQSFPNLNLVYLELIYGFLVYSFSRHSRYQWVKPLILILALIISFVVVVAKLYFAELLPSEIAVSRVFGAVWLSLSILLLEIRRLILIL